MWWPSLVHLHLICTVDIINFAVNIIASLLSFSVNVAYGWTSPMLPLLMHPDKSPIPITSDEGSWIVAIYVIGTIVGIIAHCVIVSKFNGTSVFSDDTCGIFDGKVSSSFYVFLIEV